MLGLFGRGLKTKILSNGLQVRQKRGAVRQSESEGMAARPGHHFHTRARRVCSSPCCGAWARTTTRSWRAPRRRQLAAPRSHVG